jgi:hypothetical protein
MRNKKIVTLPTLSCLATLTSPRRIIKIVVIVRNLKEIVPIMSIKFFNLQVNSPKEHTIIHGGQKNYQSSESFHEWQIFVGLNSEKMTHKLIFLNGKPTLSIEFDWGLQFKNISLSVIFSEFRPTKIWHL